MVDPSARGGTATQGELAQQLQLALDAGRLGTWRWDMVRGEVVWDQRLEALYGLPAGGFDGTFEAYEALLHPDDRDQVLAAIREGVDGKGPYRVQHKVVWPDGSVHWIAGAGNVTLDAGGLVVGTIGFSMDVTEQIVRQQELERLAAAATTAARTERVLRERIEFLATINDSLNAATGVAEIMGNVTRVAVPRLGDWCAIHVLGPEGSTPTVEVHHVEPEMVEHARELFARFPYDPAAASGVPRVIRTGQPELHRAIDEAVIDRLDVDHEIRAIVERLGLRSAITVPIAKKGRVLGAMQFVVSDPDRRYDEDDLALALLVAARIGVSLENRRLSDEQRLIAETLQRSLLPRHLPAVPGVDVAVRYWAAGESTEVGGDFYDVFPLERAGHWAVVVGDVCGKGPAAAAVTGLARHTVRDAAWHGDDPQAVMAALNRAVRVADGDAFLTAVYGVLEAEGEGATLTVAAAGHPLPVVVTADGARTAGAPGTLLGVFPSVTTRPERVHLDRGDVVVLYTDGATDVPPPHGLTAEELCELVGEAVGSRTGAGAEDVADRIQERLEQVLAFRQRGDDIALLVLRVE